MQTDSLLYSHNGIDRFIKTNQCFWVKLFKLYSHYNVGL